MAVERRKRATLEPGGAQDPEAGRAAELALFPVGPGLTPRLAPELGDLIQRMAKQDRSAFGILFRSFSPRIKGYLMRYGASGDKAEEVTQDVMIALWDKAASFDPKHQSALAWVFRIARNRSIDLWRKEARQSQKPDDPSLYPDAPVPPDDMLAYVERLRAVRRALGRLPTEEALLLRLSYFDDLSHSQIAERLGWPLGTTKTRIRLAGRKVAAILDVWKD